MGCCGGELFCSQKPSKTKFCLKGARESLHSLLPLNYIQNGRIAIPRSMKVLYTEIKIPQIALPGCSVGIQAEISTHSSGAHFLGLPEPFETSGSCIIVISHSILHLFKTLATFLNSRAPVVINCTGYVLLP